MEWLFHFPKWFKIDATAIDRAVRNFAVSAEGPLGAVKNGINALVNLVALIMNNIPWPVLILIAVYLGWKIQKKFLTGVLYGTLIFLIGLAGLWELMNVTLAVVLSSVLIALVLGIPIGILMSGSDRANRIIRPILDTMQTMPVFVYLIPALLLFGTGNASGVIATVIYAVVPVIRLTSLGIRQVDKEVIEASKAFGATSWQTLKKVQIPQAMPTIMTGINQTLMMAMAMVVTTSMIGVRGLGMEVLNAVNRIEIGRGLIAGGSVVILAVVIDRIMQGLARDKKQRLQEAGDD